MGHDFQCLIFGDSSGQIKESGKNVKHKGHVAYSDIRSKFHSTGPSRSSTMEYGHPSISKSYIRHGATHPRGAALESKSVMVGVVDGNTTLSVTPGPPSHHLLRSSEDNLVLSTSSSASKMNEISNTHVNGIQLQPRLSKSEENLIDLDTDGLGFTLENPLYDLLTDNNVFEESDKTDAELLNEYGLTDYFAQMNLSTGSDTLDLSSSTNSSNQNQLTMGAFLNANTSGISQGNKSMGSFGNSWTTFE